MAENQNRQPSPEYLKRLEIAKTRDILEVANELGMELERVSSDSYQWKDHDSLKISPKENLWHWFSRHEGGDVIELVKKIKEVDFKEAIQFLNTGEFKTFDSTQIVPQEPFKYYLKPYEKEFSEARTYLQEVRGLSNETIDFFKEQGVLAQANAKVGDRIEPVVVFKTLDNSGEVTGASLQGLIENRELYPKHGYHKQIMRSSDGLSGMHVDIGQPNRVVFAESPIDLMSYYQVNQNKLSNVRLVAMDGLKDETVSRHFMEIYAMRRGQDYSVDENTPEALSIIGRTTQFFQNEDNKGIITLAVDNDNAGRDFIEKFKEMGVEIVSDIPPLANSNNQNKIDWNDYLKTQGQFSTDPPVDLSNSSNGINPIAQRLIDNGVFNQWSKQPNIYFVSDLRRVAFELGEDGDFTVSKNYAPRTEQEKARVDELLKELSDNPNQDSPDPSMEQGVLFNNLAEVTSIPAQSGLSEEQINHLSEFLKTKISEIKIDTEMAGVEMVRYRFNGLLITEHAANLPNLSFEAQHKAFVDLLTLNYGEPVNSFRPNGPVFNLDYFKEALGYNPDTPIEAYQQATSLQATYTPPADSGVPVSLYSGHTHIGTIDFNDLFNNANFGGIADELGYGWAVDPKEMAAVIHGETLTQRQVDTIIDRMIFEDGIEGHQLKALIAQDGFTFKGYAESGLETAPKKTLDQNQESLSSVGEFHRTSDYSGEISPRTASQPVGEAPQPYFPVTSQLHFTTKGAYVSNRKVDYHIIDDKELRRLNRFAPSLQTTAQWYLNELADSKISYVLATETGDREVVQVNFQKKNFAHLAGISPLNRTMEETLDDLANGRGDFDNIQMSNASRDKMKVLPLLPEIVEAGAFVFNDLSDIEKLHNIDMAKAINPEDTDLLILFKNTEREGLLPASIMRIKGKLNDNLEKIDQQVVLGVYRERNGELDQLSINESFITDGGRELKSLLASKALTPLEEIGDGQPQPSQLKKNEAEPGHEDNVNFDYKSATASELSKQALSKIREYTQDPEELVAYMDFMSKFPKISPRNAALVLEQWPGATAVATYDQWKILGKKLGITEAEVNQERRTYTNKKTGKTHELEPGLSVKMNETSKITLFRPMMANVIEFTDANGELKTKPFKYATAEEKQSVKQGRLQVKNVPVKDKEGRQKFTTYKVFEISQTNLKHEAYPKAMPNRHYDFNTDRVKVKEVTKGLEDYAKRLGVGIELEDDHVLGSAKGAFFPDYQKILLNRTNNAGEMIGTTIHELAHATLHNPAHNQGKELPKATKELEAEMTSYLVSKHFGLDTSEKAIKYLATWTENLQTLDDKELSQSMGRIQRTTHQIVQAVEKHTKPLEPKRDLDLRPPNFTQGPNKGPKL